MVEHKEADGAIFVGLPIRMVMKREEHNEKEKAYSQRQGYRAMPEPRGMPPDLLLTVFQGFSPDARGSASAFLFSITLRPTMFK